MPFRGLRSFSAAEREMIDEILNIWRVVFGADGEPNYLPLDNGVPVRSSPFIYYHQYEHFHANMDLLYLLQEPQSGCL